jgi:ribonuclease Y
MTVIQIIIAVLALIASISIGYYLRLIISLGKRGSMELEIKQMMINAKEEANHIIEDAKKQSEEILHELRQTEKEKEHEFKKTEERLIKKESLLDTRQTDIDRDVEHVKNRIEEIKQIKERAEKMEGEKKSALENIARLTEEEARTQLLEKTEQEYGEDLYSRMQKLERSGQEQLERRAKDIMSTVIQRLSTSTASDMLTTSVSITSEDIKGKIIGKEGRNIRAFERVAGVELIVDETPGSIVISSFDPIRRQVARLALENLISDGRIQPAKIEEMIEKAQLEINTIIKKEGERAVYECGILNLDPRIVAVIGRLHFRTSYGQNVLQHSIEMTHIAGMLAEELGADVQITKAGALVHDIGKALDHEVQGTHIDIGIRILQKFNADPRIITAMKSHHDDCPHESLEAIIVQTADYISGGRPGARRDTVENYLKRLAELEALVNSFEGIEKSYAIQAGREVRIFVNPLSITDIQAKHLARDIALRIEQELRYPGEIKITVIRENRIVEIAR